MAVSTWTRLSCEMRSPCDPHAYPLSIRPFLRPICPSIPLPTRLLLSTHPSVSPSIHPPPAIPLSIPIHPHPMSHSLLSPLCQHLSLWLRTPRSLSSCAVPHLPPLLLCPACGHHLLSAHPLPPWLGSLGALRSLSSLFSQGRRVTSGHVVGYALGDATNFSHSHGRKVSSVLLCPGEP